MVYHSKPSDSDLLHEVTRSWHQTQAANPTGEDAQGWRNREEIQNKRAAHQAASVSGEVIVCAEDECHLVWGAAIGSVWGRRNERTAVPMAHVKHRPRSYGVMHRYNQEFIVSPDEQGNGVRTVSVMEYLQELYPGQQFIFLWDGATYPGGEAVQTYLKQVNHGLDEKDWKVTCILLAPNAPHQNPVEEVGLQGKNFLRRHFYENKTFQQIKRSFFNFLNKKVFNFEKPKWYLEILQPV